MADTDESLLKSFAIDRDEKAFRTLSERYLGLIFHIALRRTGNRQLAEEVSQNILCALAQKASSMAKNPDLLPAWLHRATLFESSKAMRSESFHQRRKQLLSSGESAESPSPWSDAIPHLDLALDKLPESDRRVLLLHFFEDRPFPKIARALGKNPAAVQKQSRRALEKLARILRGKGVVLTVTALATGLTSELAKAAPSALMQSCIAGVITGTATYSTTGLTLMFTSKSKALIPLVLLLFAVPLILQQVAISKVRAHINDSRASLLLTGRVASPAGNRNRSVADRRSGIVTNLDIHVLLDEQRDVLKLGGPRWAAFENKLSSLDPPTLVKLIREGAILRVNRDTKRYLIDSLVSALAKKDAQLAVVTAAELMNRSPYVASAFGRTTVADHFAAWAKSDLSAAKAWLAEEEQTGNFGNPNRVFPLSMNALRSPLVAALIEAKSPDLRSYLLGMSEQERSYQVTNSMRHGGGMKFRPSGNETHESALAAYIPVIREFLPEKERKAALESLVNALTIPNQDYYAPARELLSKTTPTPGEKEIIARRASETIMGNQSSTDPEVAARDLAETRTFLQEVIPEQADQILDAAIEKTALHRTYVAKLTIEGLRRNLEATDEEIVSELTRRNLKSHFAEALEIAERIKDPVKRASTIESLNKQ